MSHYLVRRTLLFFPQILILSIITFGITRLVPGDPGVFDQVSDLMAMADPRFEETLRMHLGLDRPLHIQYLDWVTNALQFDFGYSYVNLSLPVSDLIRQRLGPTLLLTGTALLIATVGGTLIGAIAARWRNTWLDHTLTSFTFFFLSVPNFWAAIIAITIFSISLGWLPSGGIAPAGQEPTAPVVARHLILPASVLGLSLMATITRFVRSSVIEVMNDDFVRTARAKGLRERRVFLGHALRNALLPVVTITGLRLPILIGGSVLVETVFSWPGLGRASVDAALSRDYPITMAMVMFVGTLTIFGNLLADLTYGLLDPRIKESA